MRDETWQNTTHQRHDTNRNELTIDRARAPTHPQTQTDRQTLTGLFEAPKLPERGFMQGSAATEHFVKARKRFQTITQTRRFCLGTHSRPGQPKLRQEKSLRRDNRPGRQLAQQLETSHRKLRTSNLENIPCKTTLGLVSNQTPWPTHANPSRGSRHNRRRAPGSSRTPEKGRQGSVFCARQTLHSRSTSGACGHIRWSLTWHPMGERSHPNP